MSATGTSRPRVVVVGGGYGGTAVASALDEHVEVVLVEPKDAFVHCVAALRAAVDAEWTNRIFLPYDRLLTNGRVVRDRAVRVEPGRVTLASGPELDADVVVLATGSSYPFPAKPDHDDADDAIARFGATREAIAKAGSVLLVGAGPVGIELAGEIDTVWPGKPITLLDQADDVMGPRFATGLKDELRRQLADRGVRLVLGSPLRSLPPQEPGEVGAFTVVTEAGVEVSAEIWFRCWGVTPVSDLLAGDLAGARRPDGFVEVTPTLRLPGQERVFAIGDMTHGEAKMASIAGRQGRLVAANILALLDGGELEPWVSPGPSIAVPIGPTGGAGQLAGREGIAGPDVVAELKGRDLNLAGLAARLGVDVA